MMQLSTIANALNAQMLGSDVTFASVGTDSRHITQGQLFVALKGDKFDGHAYAAQALKDGAAAVMIANASLAVSPAIVVKDTYQALGEMAAFWRDQFTLPIAAITGSSGKTTVKEMLAAILSAASGDKAAVLATEGNLNNHIGLPLTLLKLNAQHQFAVIEMGMNHAGEIRYLTKLTKPQVALINNAGTAHIGELGSRENIAKAKAEIFEGLSKNGTAVINADDDFAAAWLAQNQDKKIMTFGLTKKADVSAQYQTEDGAMQLQLSTPNGAAQVKLHVLGEHNVRNALAASAAALALGVSLDDVVTGLGQFASVKGRLNWLQGLHGARLIDDTYNANPDSMRAAIDVLSTQQGTPILVMGDMGELGDDAADMHAQIGQYAQQKGIAQLLATGELSAHAVQHFGANAQHFLTKEALIAGVLPLMKSGATVLVKGSRFMRMEQVVAQLKHIN
jgi:UDP-N-acetylmuramoyl-tripeptide--D-alanyl-D-alanine ligase